MNYGAIGFVIGHEITHGFDDQGRQFDKEGNLVEWWEPETKEKYLSKAECIIHQYGNYTAKEVGLKVSLIVFAIFKSLYSLITNDEIQYKNKHLRQNFLPEFIQYYKHFHKQISIWKLLIV